MELASMANRIADAAASEGKFVTTSHPSTQPDINSNVDIDDDLPPLMQIGKRPREEGVEDAESPDTKRLKGHEQGIDSDMIINTTSSAEGFNPAEGSSRLEHADFGMNLGSTSTDVGELNFVNGPGPMPLPIELQSLFDSCGLPTPQSPASYALYNPNLRNVRAPSRPQSPRLVRMPSNMALQMVDAVKSGAAAASSSSQSASVAETPTSSGYTSYAQRTFSTSESSPFVVNTMSSMTSDSSTQFAGMDIGMNMSGYSGVSGYVTNLSQEEASPVLSTPQTAAPMTAASDMNVTSISPFSYSSGGPSLPSISSMLASAGPEISSNLADLTTTSTNPTSSYSTTLYQSPTTNLAPTFTTPDPIPGTMNPSADGNAPTSNDFIPLEGPVVVRRHAFRVGDIVVVEGIDGKEYYGQIKEFFLAVGKGVEIGEEPDDDKWFKMIWLDPEVPRHREAILFARSLERGEFKIDQHETIEAMACIKRVQEKKNVKPPSAASSRRSSIFRSGTAATSGSEAASVAASAVVTGAGRTTGGKRGSMVAMQGPSVSVVGTAKTELDQLHQLALLKGLKCGQYIGMVAPMLSSHIHLFLNLFGRTFIEWITWMQQSDYTRFLEYFTRITKEEFFRAEHLSKGGDPLTFPKVGAEYLKDLTTLPSGTCRVSRFALTLFGTHFVEVEGLPRRIGKFLDLAQAFARTYRPELYGWCPLQMYRTTEFYPFHLVQLGRIAALLPELSITCPPQLLADISHLSARASAASSLSATNKHVPSPTPSPGSDPETVTHHATAARRLSIQHKAPVGTLIPTSQWKNVYGPEFPTEYFVNAKTPSIGSGASVTKGGVGGVGVGGVQQGVVESLDMPGAGQILNGDTYAAVLPPLPEPRMNRRVDQNRLREMRKKLEGHATMKDVEALFAEVVDEAVDLCTDYIGNVVIQKIIEKSTDAHRLRLIEKVAPHMAAIGVHKNGTWVIQKMIDYAKTTTQIHHIINALKPFTPPLLLDQFGNYVVQCCLRLGTHRNQFVFDAMAAKCWEVGQGRFGSRAMRACLESQFTTKRQQKMVAVGIVGEAVRLCTNPNGAILITWLLDTSSLPGRYRVLAPKLVGSVGGLCCHKLASAVVLKLVNQRVELDARDTIIKEIFFTSDQSLEEILADQVHGVSVIQKILASACVSADEKLRLADRVRTVLSRMPEVKDNQMGYKRLLDELSVIPGGAGMMMGAVQGGDQDVVSPLTPGPGFFVGQLPASAGYFGQQQQSNGNGSTTPGS
ncbi:hypothetical protein HK097_011536, partial [Rhizophlyctis rosea]